MRNGLFCIFLLVSLFSPYVTVGYALPDFQITPRTANAILCIGQTIIINFEIINYGDNGQVSLVVTEIPENIAHTAVNPETMTVNNSESSTTSLRITGQHLGITTVSVELYVPVSSNGDDLNITFYQLQDTATITVTVLDPFLLIAVGGFVIAFIIGLVVLRRRRARD